MPWTTGSFEGPFALTCTTPPLEEDLEVTGQPQTVLHFSSSTDITAFSAKLCDVAPDGTTVLVSRRALNATHRESHSKPTTLKPGTIYELRINMDVTSYLFREGHRLKLYIACAEFPYLWPTPKPAVNTIHRGSLYPSRIELPVVPAREYPKAPNFPHPPQVEAYADQEMVVPHYWRVSRDMRKRSASVEWGNIKRFKPDEETVVEREQRVTVTANSADRPADVVLDSFGRFTVTKPSGTVDTRGKVYIRSDEHVFHTLATLDITYDGKPYFHRDWRAYYPRKFR